MKYVLRWVFAICLLLSLAVGAYATENQVAQDITDSTAITGIGKKGLDGDQTTCFKSDGDLTVTLKNDSGMGALYVIYNYEYGSYSVTDTDTGKTVTAGENEYLHEYVNLVEAFGTAPKNLKLSYENGSVRINEMYVLSEGAAPDFVQQWEHPWDGCADLVLFSTHGDDDQLFFAGLLPLYAAERDYRVQVVYMTDHRSGTSLRTHEMLNGLWAVGVRAYPVFGKFDDFRIDSLSGTYQEYERRGTSKDELLEFMVTQIRRFRPQAAIGHDIQGEYGHGMHMVYTDLLMQAAEITNDAAQYPQSAQTYGVWDIPKIYLHLYGENKIVIDYDQPLEAFDGMTAFEVTQKLGFPCHVTQQWTWFKSWINGKTEAITKASQIKTYNPCEFGLYRSTVGEDTAKNDFMENLTSYAEQERIAEEQRLEEERKRQEELERQEEERRRQEALEKQQEEERAREQAEQAAQEALRQQEQEAARRQNMIRYALLGGAALMALVAVILILVLLFGPGKTKRNKRSGKYRSK